MKRLAQSLANTFGVRVRCQGESGQRLALRRFDLPDDQVRGPRQLGFNRFPPHRRAAGKADHGDFFRPPGGAHQALVVGLAHLDPMDELAGEVLVPEIGFIGVPQTLGQFERALVVVSGQVQRQAEQAQALQGFQCWRGRMLCDGACHGSEFNPCA